jgi:Glycosyl hydrolase family 76
LTEGHDHPSRRHLCVGLLSLLLAGAGCALFAPAAPGAATATYPGHISRPLTGTRRSAALSGARHPRSARQAKAGRPARATLARRKARKPTLKGNPARAQLAFQAMQKYYYITGSGLYAGEPFSTLWPFSQALAATVSMSAIPGMMSSLRPEVHARLIGLRSYLDTSNSGAPEGTYTSTLPAFDAAVAPPAGPGGPKFYDDNDWIGIELARLYELTHSPSMLGSAEGIMAFEMAGWQADPELACAGGIPFSNSTENAQRNTVTNAPTVELGVQLYRITGDAQYLRFAETAYEWVRNCLLQPNGLYADHIRPHGVVDQSLWSYTQGTMIGAGTLLYQATHNSAYLYQARQTAGAALAYFTPERLRGENPFFPSVYFRNLLYLDSVTHDPPGPKLAQAYVNYAWQHQRLSSNLFVSGSPPSAQLLSQAAIVKIYALLSSPPGSYF